MGQSVPVACMKTASKVKSVAGPSGQGADVVFEFAGHPDFIVEMKSVLGFGGFNKELTEAALVQAPDELVVFQVKNGTDLSKWLAKYWGAPVRLAERTSEELQILRRTEVTILDEGGRVVLPRQPIYNL